MNQNEEFIRITFNKALLPCMLAMLAVNINVIVDGILVSNMIGQSALAAINLSLPLYLALCVVGSFFGYGSSTNASHALGTNNSKVYLSYYRTGTNLLIIVSLLITVLGLIFIEPIDAVLCSDPYIRRYVHEYVLITLIGTLPKTMIYVPFGYLRLDGRNTEVMVMMGVMSVGNIILDIVFIRYLHMGVFGAGLASVIATLIACIMGFFWLSDSKSSFKYKPYISKSKFELKKIATSGTPFGLNNLLSTVRLLMINSMLMAFGGGQMVAIFTAVNGVIGFAECITLGVPQAGNSILGVFQGEKDNTSSLILFKRALRTGFLLLLGFSVIIMLSSDFISKIYGISGLGYSLFFPLLMMVFGLFPNLFCNMVSNFYNLSGRDTWANFLILLRGLVMTYVSLMLSMEVLNNPWPFLMLTEVFTVIVWFIAARLRHMAYPENTMYLFIDDQHEKEGRVLNFSVNDTVEDICDASERIADFCGENGLDTKQTMRISMAIEEILTLVKLENEPESLHFDLRAYALQDVLGIRFRYDGKFFNPFHVPEEDPDDKYMGATMISNLVELVCHYRTFGTNTVQVVLRGDN